MCEQALRLGHFVDIAEPRAVAGGGLIERGARCRHLHGRVGGDTPRAIERGDSGVPLRAQVGRDLARAGGLRADGGGLRSLARMHGRQIGYREADGEAEGVILNVGRQAVEAAQDSAVGFGARAACVGRALQIESREIGALERPELRLRLAHDRILFGGDGVGRRIERRGAVFRRQLQQSGGGDG